MADSTATIPTLEDFRRDALTFLESSFAPRTEPWVFAEAESFTPEVMAENRRLQKKLFNGGYAGLSWPLEYGGRGLPIAYEWAFQEVSADFVLPHFGLLHDTTFYTCVPTMLAHAPADFLAWFIPQVLAGDALVCQFFSEPGAGSDLAAARTRAERRGEDWVLNGQKVWSSSAHLADWGMCLARTNWSVPKHAGLTWFAVPCAAPGLAIRVIEQITGSAEFCEEFFDDVVVPDFHRICEIDQGWAAAQTMLVLERGAGRSVDGGPLGPAGPLPADLVSLASAAGRLDDPSALQVIGRFHAVSFVARALNYRLGQLERSGQLNPGTAAYAKLFAGTFDPLRARAAVQLGGAGAMVWRPDDGEAPTTSLNYLKGRTVSIAGGTNEMQRNAIGDRALGMPREARADADQPFSQVPSSGATAPNGATSGAAVTGEASAPAAAEPDAGPNADGSANADGAAVSRLGLGVPMDFETLVRQRRSIRGYLKKPVPRQVIEEVLELAAGAPSSMNIQPWHFHVVTGEPLDRIREGNSERMSAGAEIIREVPLKDAFSGIYRDRQVEIAIQLYESMGIVREDKERRNDWTMRGFRQFDAPVSIVVTYEKVLEPAPVTHFDLGAVTYGLVLAAWTKGLGTVINGQGIMQAPVVREHAQIPDDQVIFTCVAMGYPDEEFEANYVKSRRIPPKATFLGFGD